MLRCLRCHKPMRGPRTKIVNGMSAHCYAKWLNELQAEAASGAYGSLYSVGLACVRRPNNELLVNVPRSIVYHSPTGFEWGYRGSGPADLALNAMHRLLPPKDKTLEIAGVVVSAEAWEAHQEFKERFVATLPPKGGVIPIGAIRKWIAAWRRMKEDAA